MDLWLAIAVAILEALVCTTYHLVKSDVIPPVCIDVTNCHAPRRRLGAIHDAKLMNERGHTWNAALRQRVTSQSFNRFIRRYLFLGSS